MAERFDDPTERDDLEGQPPSEQAVREGYAEEAPEMEEEDQPRRAASARFIVESEVGSEAMLRDAMDPANQSLADALRLSFRVLQAVIIVLIVLFLASGFRTVDDGYSGVKTVWGDISKPLTPGPQFSWLPYPIVEFVTFRAENRSVDLGEHFKVMAGRRTEQQIMETQEIHTPLQPGRDGYLITRDGDLAHLEVGARYEIEQPMDFVHKINDAAPGRNGDGIVRMALARAAIHVVGGMSLQEITDSNRQEEFKENIRLGAQQVLDEVGSGVRLVDISSLHGSPPIAIEKTMGALTEAQVEGARMTQDATKQSNQTLQSIAGGGYVKLLGLIEQYEVALDAGEEEKSAQLLNDINATLESGEVTGEVSQIIYRARAYQATIESTLGNEYRRFESLLAAYRKDPNLVIRQQWLAAYRDILNQADTEIWYVPDATASIRLVLAGSAEIQNVRNDQRLQDRQRALTVERGPYVPRGEEMAIGRPGRQLKQGAGGEAVPVGTGN
jgi:regulator of protease activity HflC (stomatin/prohibitin superfamily)